MKICLITDPKFIPTQELAKYLVGKGHEVHMISYNNKEIEGVVFHCLIPLRNSSNRNQQSKIRMEKEKLKSYLKKKKRIYDFRQRLREISHKLNSFRLGFGCKQILREIKPDIVHGHGLVNHGFFSAMSGFKPLVVTAWGSDILVHAKKDIFYRFIARYTTKKADFVNAVSAITEKALENIGVPKNKVINFTWGIDCELFSSGYGKKVNSLKKKLNINNSSPIVLSNRSMTPLYNIKGIVSAIPAVISKHPDVIFIFLRGYGTQEYEKELVDEAISLGVQNNTRFISQLVSQEDIPAFYNMSDMVVSIPHSDGMPASVREGMACGCIPILSNIEANRELIKHGENGFLVENNGKGNLASVINYCLDNLDDLKRKIAIANRAFIVKYHSWRKTTEILDDIYLRLSEKYKTKGLYD